MVFPGFHGVGTRGTARDLLQALVGRVSRDELVAASAHGDDSLREAGLSLDLVAERGDVDFARVPASGVAALPEFTHQLVSRDDLVGMRRQEPEQSELGRREPYGVPRDCLLYTSPSPRDGLLS